MALVDHSARSLESCPYLFAQFLGNGASLAIFLMQFLQLVECADDILLICKLLGSLTQFSLQFKVFLEVIFTCLDIEFEHVVELLHIELVITPQLISLGGRHTLDFLPFLLQCLKLRIRLAGILG